jgi:poly-gamma-glutamate capsule biosynthesis protein CapA/YwtB (metallophosphatase superfamily)
MRARIVVAQHDRAMREFWTNDKEVRHKARILSAVNRAEIRHTPMVVSMHMQDA